VRGCATPCKESGRRRGGTGEIWVRSKVGMGEWAPRGFGTPNCTPSRIPEAFQGDTNVSVLTETQIRNGPDKCRWLRASRVIEGWMRS